MSDPRRRELSQVPFYWSLKLGLAPFLGASLVFSACTFNTWDHRRPLVPDRVPVEPSRISTDVVFETDGANEAGIRQSLELTRLATRYFHVHSYHDISPALPRIMKALNTAPENPYAWNQLGADLLLLEEVEAAIASVEKAVEILDRSGAQGDEAQLLRSISLLNLASFREMAERPREALAALERLGDPDRLDAFRRLAFYWIAARVYLELDETQVARMSLERAKEIAEEALAEFKDQAHVRFTINSDYPQYFVPRTRAATQKYLEGLLIFAEQGLNGGAGSGALAALSEALRLDRRLWEARFSRAALLLIAGRLGVAEREFQQLISELEHRPNYFYRPERILFNVGILRLEQRRFEEAITHLEASVDTARASRSSFLRVYDKSRKVNDPHGVVHRVLEPAITRVLAPPNACTEVLQDPQPHNVLSGFPEAHANLGIAYMERWDANGFTSDLEKAAEALCVALLHPGYQFRHTAFLQLGRVYMNRGDGAGAVAAFAGALEESAAYPPALEALYKTGSEARHPELRRTAFAHFVSALEAIGVADPRLIDFRDELVSLAGQLRQEEERELLMRVTHLIEELGSSAVDSNAGPATRDQ